MAPEKGSTKTAKLPEMRHAYTRQHVLWSSLSLCRRYGLRPAVTRSIASAGFDAVLTAECTAHSCDQSIMPAIPGTPRLSTRTDLDSLEDIHRFSSTHELACPQTSEQFLAETNAIVLAETTYLRYTFRDKSLLRAALRPLSRSQTQLARIGLERIRHNVSFLAKAPPKFPNQHDEGRHTEFACAQFWPRMRKADSSQMCTPNCSPKF